MALRLSDAGKEARALLKLAKNAEYTRRSAQQQPTGVRQLGKLVS